MSTSIAQFGAPASTAKRQFRVVDGGLTIAMLLLMAAIATPQFAPAAEEDDPRTVALTAQIGSLQSAIERYRGASTDSCYPDLVQQGWAPLIERGLVHEAPTDRLNGRSDVATAPAPG